MAATGTPTPNIGLRIPLGTDPASVDDINYNSNALDTVIGDIGETSVAGQLSATNNRISAVQDGLAIVCNGNTHAAIEAGQFAYVKNHGTLAEGLYRNNTGSTIAANATLSSSNLTADTSGGLNTVYDALNNRIGKQQIVIENNQYAKGIAICAKDSNNHVSIFIDIVTIATVSNTVAICNIPSMFIPSSATTSILTQVVDISNKTIKYTFTDGADIQTNGAVRQRITSNIDSGLHLTILFQY